MGEPQYLDGDDTARGIDDDENDEKDDSHDTLEELEGLKQQYPQKPLALTRRGFFTVAVR